HLDLGENAQARICLEKADPIYVRLIRDYPDTRTYRTNRVSCLLKLAEWSNAVGNARQGEESILELLAVRRGLCEKHPDEEEFPRKLSLGYRMLADLYEGTRQYAKAEKTHLELIALLDGQLKSLADRTKAKIRLAGAHCNLGNFLSGYSDRASDALKRYNSAIKLLEEALAESPEDRNGREFLRNCYIGRSTLHRHLKRNASMLDDRQEVLVYQEQLVCRFPEVPRWRRDLALELQVQAGLQEGLGRVREGEAFRLRAIEILEDLVTNWPDDNLPVRSRLLLAEAHGNLGD